MYKVANLSAEERAELFTDAADKMSVHAGIVEKDFWVCLVLHMLFTSSLKDSIVFKGGTSLSKAFDVISRFSEDIDLILDWKLLGYDSSEEGKDPWYERSNSKQDALNKEVNKRASEYISNELIPLLNQLFKDSRIEGLYAELDPDDTLFYQTVRVFYPKSFTIDYMRPEIKLEIGPLASWIPQGEFEIRSYVEENVSLSELFDETIKVNVIKAERTFWEKCTILHQEANRSIGKAFPLRYSRHYYDVYKMANSEIKNIAFQKIGMLDDVVEFKQKFYPCAWARYDEATRENIKLKIPPHNYSKLKDDYAKMKEEMFFGDIPEFEDVMSYLSELEEEIHSLAR